MSSYRLSNYDIMPVRIVGAATGCSCHTPEDEELPFEISAGGSKTFTIKFHAYGDPRAVSLPIDLYTNNPAQPKLVLTIAGEIVDPRRPRKVRVPPSLLPGTLTDRPGLTPARVGVGERCIRSCASSDRRSRKHRDGRIGRGAPELGQPGGSGRTVDSPHLQRMLEYAALLKRQVYGQRDRGLSQWMDLPPMQMPGTTTCACATDRGHHVAAAKCRRDLCFLAVVGNINMDTHQISCHERTHGPNLMSRLTRPAPFFAVLALVCSASRRTRRNLTHGNSWTTIGPRDASRHAASVDRSRRDP